MWRGSSMHHAFLCWVVLVFARQGNVAWFDFEPRIPGGSEIHVTRCFFLPGMGGANGQLL